MPKYSIESGSLRTILDHCKFSANLPQVEQTAASIREFISARDDPTTEYSVKKDMCDIIDMLCTE
jgi:hypothetical protein